MAFRDELERLINRCSMERGSNTPDFILAEFLVNCLVAFDTAVNHRITWYGAAVHEDAVLSGDGTPNKEEGMEIKTDLDQLNGAKGEV